MANKYGNIEDDKYFDISVPDGYFSDVSKEKLLKFAETHPIRQYFKGHNTKEFYEGMIAGFRTATSLVKSIRDRQELDDLIIAASLYATLLAKQKDK